MAAERSAAALLEETRASWNAATRIHNAHKRDQAAFLKGGGSTLFHEEIELVGDVKGKRFLHTLCNAGQDTLSFALRGADVTGVDLSDEAVSFATQLAKDAGIAATFERSEAIAWLEADDGRRFDVVFGSYGCLTWLADLPRFMRGVARRLVDGGRVAFLEIHPLTWSFDKDRAFKDPYFAPGHVFSEPVGDYVAASGDALLPMGRASLAESGAGDVPRENTQPAHGYQHTTADIVQAMVDAGLRITAVREWPYVNGCRVHDGLVDVGDRRFAWPAPVSLPLMLGVAGVRA